ELPEVGDIDKPKLAFFFDEAHLLFANASKALLEQVQQVVRLIRSKGVGVYFITQSPKDIPETVLGQLGHRVQHALRAFTPDDDKALRAAARTFPKTPFYDVEETLTTLGIGEAFVTVLTPRGVPTQPFATRLIPPSSKMGPLADLDQAVSRSMQVRKYSQAIDRESAREKLAARVMPESLPMPGAQREEPDTGPADAPVPAPPRATPRRGKEPPGTLEQVMKSPVARTVAGAITRGLMGALLGAPRRRSTRRRW
ncbi:MAG TPA: helicase HerA-like domain-containing protein, partial [Gemmatimonadaceae bacterium]|nr:helicase HerA-like domain-containing protein [Gemmatimonadaceae bacterium]